ncbi:YqzL family protein [Herbivorax sp. ANBcel31]|nr:YqzL family protein [Herbivorax sp. ANBcel31]MDQ2085986.1 YqzL family protein [Herbivorax sp. ANBcel31]
MLKDFAWKAFENTGDITTYMFLKEIEEKKRVIEETKMVKEEVAIGSTAV